MNDCVGVAMREPGVTVKLVVGSLSESDDAWHHFESIVLPDSIDQIDRDLLTVFFANGSRVIVQIGDASRTEPKLIVVGWFERHRQLVFGVIGFVFIIVAWATSGLIGPPKPASPEPVGPTPSALGSATTVDPSRFMADLTDFIERGKLPLKVSVEPRCYLVTRQNLGDSRNLVVDSSCLRQGNCSRPAMWCTTGV